MSERSFLEEISIRNLGVIEQSELELGPGLNVLTGETGAGKTMILTALSLVLGGKSDSALVRHGADRLSASATFAIAASQVQGLEELGAQLDANSLIISRTVNADGKSKALCGGVTVPAATLATISQNLIEIHGQSANAQITKTSTQRELLDRYGGSDIAAVLTAYQLSYGNYLELKARLAELKSSSSKRDSDIAQLREFITAWASLKAVRDECAATDNEINRLSSVEDLRLASQSAQESLETEEAGALTLLHTARRALDSVKSKDSRLESIADRVSEAVIILDDAATDLASYATGLEADPRRLDALNERKSQLNAFIKKWGGGAGGDEELVLLAAKAKSGKEVIADLEGGDDRIAELESSLTAAKKDLLKQAKTLTEVRSKSARTLADLVTIEIHALAMPHTQFFVEVTSPDYSSNLKESDFTQFGCDEISMLIRAHLDGPKVALGKGASGGEMSRIMLALEVVIAQTHPVGTYIFDEVDAGVGGKAAIEVGKRLHQLSKQAQVIVVTHLPQVAAWADTHFVVKKSSDGAVVAAGVAKVEDADRVEEIARMLAGLEESASAREHASELLALRG